MTEQQPMKMAAAEALYKTEQPASFSLFTIGSLDGRGEVRDQGPGPVVVSGHRELRRQGGGDQPAACAVREDVRPGSGTAYYSPGDYTPIIPVTYWSFRLMIGLGMFAAAVAVAAARW